MRSLTLAAALLIGGCSTRSSGAEVLDVYAASSLTDAFADMERDFEAAHPGVNVRVTFAGSQVLRLQIEQGAPADVFASANPEHVRALTAAGLASEPVTFAYNELIVIVPIANPADIDSFEQLPDAERIVLGTENVPAGIYAREVLQLATEELGSDFGARVLAHVVSQETNVRLARTKVELGEADAAIVYRTDARASSRVLVVAIPREMNERTAYVMGRVDRTEGGTREELARAWMDFVLSPAGQRVLSRRGFIVQ